MSSSSNSPLKNMPECWLDDKRMNSLFSAFRERDVNPADWDSKLKFWRNIVNEWCLEGNQSYFSINVIKNEFKRKDRRPLCIPTVVNELKQLGEIRLKEEFLQSDPNQSWTSWAVHSLVKSPVLWTYSQVKKALIPEDYDEDVQYVNINYLKEKGEYLMSKVAGLNQSVLSCEEVKELLSSDGRSISDETLDTVLHWLVIDKKAAVERVDGKKLIKFCLPGNNNKALTVSEGDLALFKLEQSKQALIKSIDDLELEKDKCITDAKAFLAKGLRQSAKSCLKKKHELEKNISKRLNTLENLETLQSRLLNSESDAKVIEGYKMGLSALKACFKNNGLTEDGVFETMSELEELSDIQNEIEMAISKPVVSYEDEDLESELSDILSKEKAEKELPGTSFTEFLPDVPSSSPEEKKKNLQSALEIPS